MVLKYLISIVTYNDVENLPPLEKGAIYVVFTLVT